MTETISDYIVLSGSTTRLTKALNAVDSLFVGGMFGPLTNLNQETTKEHIDDAKHKVSLLPEGDLKAELKMVVAIAEQKLILQIF